MRPIISISCLDKQKIKCIINRDLNDGHDRAHITSFLDSVPELRHKRKLEITKCITELKNLFRRGIKCISNSVHSNIFFTLRMSVV